MPAVVVLPTARGRVRFGSHALWDAKETVASLGNVAARGFAKLRSFPCGERMSRMRHKVCPRAQYGAGFPTLDGPGTLVNEPRLRRSRDAEMKLAGAGGRSVVRSWQGTLRQRPFGLFSFAELRELPAAFPERGAPGAAGQLLMEEQRHRENADRSEMCSSRRISPPLRTAPSSARRSFPSVRAPCSPCCTFSAPSFRPEDRAEAEQALG